MIDANLLDLLMPGFVGDGHVGDIIDRLVHDAAARLDRIDPIAKAIESERGSVLRNRNARPREHRGDAAISEGPVQRRSRRDDHEADVRDEHATARPIVLVREGPLDPAELALAHFPSTRGEKRFDAFAHRMFVATNAYVRTERNVFDLDRAQRRKARRNHAPKRRERHAGEDESDDAEIRGRMIDVVEVQAEHDARERRRVVRFVERGVFALIDDDADQREETPHAE
jgi:hypothetical protein